jgi:hypothetical protein
MIQTLFWVATITLFICSCLSVLAGVAFMRLQEEEDLFEGHCPTDGLTREPRQRSK